MSVTESGPTMSRRHAAGADSARSLLFTVLGEFVLPDGGRAWTSTIIDALSRLDVHEKAIRQALMRTAADGWLRSERFGRRTLWCLTPKAEQLLTDGTERIYGFTGPTTDWDGQWLLALARVPETDRPARHLLRTRMSWAGFGSLAPGMWISPHTDRLDEARRILGEAGVVAESRVFVARDVTGGDEAEMAQQAWDLATLEQDLREGRFQRSLAAAAAFSAVFSGAEALYSHYKNNFRYPKLQWSPITLTPLLFAAGMGAVRSRTIARTALPVVSLLAILDGTIGTFYHARGILRRPGGLTMPLHNIMYGPPIFAPMLFAASGFMGLLASLLRREK